jgi:hypothetical protein
MLGHARHRRMTGQYDPAVPLSIAVALAAVAAIALIGVTIYRRSESRTPHLQALVDGQVTLEMLPESIQRRLADPKHRAALAGTLRKTAKDAARRPKARALPNPPVTRFFREGVRNQIVSVADLIEQPETAPEAVALTEMLLADGASPFYGDDEAALVEALVDIRAAAQSTAA